MPPRFADYVASTVPAPRTYPINPPGPPPSTPLEAILGAMARAAWLQRNQMLPGLWGGANYVPPPSPSVPIVRAGQPLTRPLSPPPGPASAGYGRRYNPVAEEY